jgi:hypothetical protein
VNSRYVVFGCNACGGAGQLQNRFLCRECGGTGELLYTRDFRQKITGDGVPVVYLAGGLDSQHWQDKVIEGLQTVAPVTVIDTRELLGVELERAMTGQKEWLGRAHILFAAVSKMMPFETLFEFGYAAALRIPRVLVTSPENPVGRWLKTEAPMTVSTLEDGIGLLRSFCVAMRYQYHTSTGEA